MANVVPPLRRAAAKAAMKKTAPTVSKSVKKQVSSKPSSAKSATKSVSTKSVSKLSTSPKSTSKSKSKSSTSKSNSKVPAKIVKSSARSSGRVVAKKMTVRAPVSAASPVRSAVVEPEIEADIELSEEESEELPAPAKAINLKVKRATNTKKKAAKKTPATTTTTATTTDTAERNKGGRPKSPPRASRPASPAKQGRPPRLLNPFPGPLKYATVAKKLFTNPQYSSADRPKAIVIEKAVYSATGRRPRVNWTPEEVECLELGVVKHGEGMWHKIINDPDYRFHNSRTTVDLKDKWRNLKAYVSYSEHPIRKFVLVDSMHQMIKTVSGNYHVFNNRWPRDAALKVATKSDFYPKDEYGNHADSAIIHLKELMDQEGKRERPQIVHVYRVTRLLQRPRNPLRKFEGYQAIWVGKVEKIAEEILIKDEEVLSPEDRDMIEMQLRRELIEQEKELERQLQEQAEEDLAMEQTRRRRL